MLNGITNNFRIITKIASLGSKFVALGMTGYGLKKIWSKETQEKVPLATRAGFSAAYLLHMGSTSLATAAWFGSDTVSPPVATALVSATSLLTSYVNLMEADINHSLLNAKQSDLEQQLNENKCHLQRNLALIKSMHECGSEIESIHYELAYLKGYQDRFNTIRDSNTESAKKELKTIYNELLQNYQDRSRGNELINGYFKQYENTDWDIISVREKIRESIDALRSKIERCKRFLDKTNHRLGNRIKTLEKELNDYGILDMQCIRYIKDRVYPQASPILNLELGEALFLDTYIEEDRKSFNNFLESSLSDYIKLLKKRFVKLNGGFIRHPTNDVQQYHSKVYELNHEIVKLKCSLSLEKLNEENKRIKLNFSSMASIIALSLCLLPESELSNILNPLMLTIGIVGGGSSLWQFYNKNLLEKRVENRKQIKTQCLDKEHFFNHHCTLGKINSAELENMLKKIKNKPEKALLPLRESLPRRAKERAMTLIKPTKTPRLTC